MTKPVKYKPIPSNVLSNPWTTFAHKLATMLAKLNQDEFLCLSVRDSDRYVRFSCEWKFGMRVDTTCNAFLDEQEHLDEQQIASLLAAGWNAPTLTPDDLLPDDLTSDDWFPDEDTDTCPNYFVDLNSPIAFDTVSDLTVHTFAHILRVPSPKRLEYYAYNEEDEPIEFPELGLPLAAPEDDGDQLELSQLLLETIRDTVGIADVEYDEDGDIGVRYRSALSFVRLTHDGLFVGIFAQLLTDVRENPAIYARLNEINSDEIMLRVFYKDGVIYAVADLPALPFVGSHVAEAFGYFCDAADRLGILLKAEFGGETAFDHNVQSNMLH